MCPTRRVYVWGFDFAFNCFVFFPLFPVPVILVDFQSAKSIGTYPPSPFS